MCFPEILVAAVKNQGCGKTEKKIRDWSHRWMEVSLIPIEIEHLKLAQYKNNQGCGVDLLSIFPTAWFNFCFEKFITYLVSSKDSVPALGLRNSGHCSFSGVWGPPTWATSLAPRSLGTWPLGLLLHVPGKILSFLLWGILLSSQVQKPLSLFISLYFIYLPSPPKTNSYSHTREPRPRPPSLRTTQVNLLIKLKA